MNRFRLVPILAVPLMLFGTRVSASAPEWMTVSQGATYKYEVRIGSIRRDDGAVYALFRVSNYEGARFERNAIDARACHQGYGRVVTIAPDFSRHHGTDFVAGGGTIASAIAGFLCLYSNRP